MLTSPSTHDARRYMLHFFFNDTATTEIYTLSLHDALPILGQAERRPDATALVMGGDRLTYGQLDVLSNQLARTLQAAGCRSEEHTSELQSQSNLVCRLLLEKKQYLSRTQSVHSQLPCHPTV